MVFERNNDTAIVILAIWDSELNVLWDLGFDSWRGREG